jgi:hypothetical protein
VKKISATMSQVLLTKGWIFGSPPLLIDADPPNNDNDVRKEEEEHMFKKCKNVY